MAHFYDADNSKPSDESVLLVKRILDQIASEEKRPIEEMEKTRLDFYMKAVVDTLQELVTMDQDRDLQKGAIALRRLRKP